MNLTLNPTTTAKAQETESDTPPPIQLPKATANHHTPKTLSIPDGILKRIQKKPPPPKPKKQNQIHHHRSNYPRPQQTTILPRPYPSPTAYSSAYKKNHAASLDGPVVQVSVSVIYKECQKNHAASLDDHALDGCGEFMPSPSATLTDPTSLKYAACGCHRNFHLRELEAASLSFDLHQHHYHPSPHPSIAARERSPNSPSSSPPSLSSSYHPSAPPMLLALSTRLSGPLDNHQIVAATTMTAATTSTNSDGRKRFRTKFNQEQKEKMFAFSERLGWKMQKKVPLNFVRRQWLALQMGC
ncbi:zinc-finger homeodomain protein 11-like [Telopea speciosissima]|uniref:zinc-finger homeodomain protein 11-like n=1 Tax=Telopea speciosissima TaxID=54955 RepID=UPI001CC81722|nr:zinc-finger homeodomain protein 11-like [Telopea speciosissima]